VHGEEKTSTGKHDLRLEAHALSLFIPAFTQLVAPCRHLFRSFWNSVIIAFKVGRRSMLRTPKTADQDLHHHTFWTGLHSWIADSYDEAQQITPVWSEEKHSGLQCWEPGQRLRPPERRQCSGSRTVTLLGKRKWHWTCSAPRADDHRPSTVGSQIKGDPGPGRQLQRSCTSENRHLQLWAYCGLAAATPAPVRCSADFSVGFRPHAKFPVHQQLEAKRKCVGTLEVASEPDDGTRVARPMAIRGDAM